MNITVKSLITNGNIPDEFDCNKIITITSTMKRVTDAIIKIGGKKFLVVSSTNNGKTGIYPVLSCCSYADSLDVTITSRGAMIKPTRESEDIFNTIMKDGNRIIDELFGDILDDIEKKFGK